MVGGNLKKNPAWKKLNSNEIGIDNTMIPRSTRVVLNGLKQQGTLELVFKLVRNLTII